MTLANFFFVAFREEFILIPCLLTDQNFAIKFWKGSPKGHFYEIISISDQLFQEEDLLRISSCPYSESSPHSLEPCLKMDQNFLNNFEKGHPRNIPVKLFQNLTCGFGEEDFLRISSCPKSHHSPEPCLLTDQNFTSTFEKGHLRDIPVKLFQNLNNGFGEEDFLRI